MTDTIKLRQYLLGTNPYIVIQLTGGELNDGGDLVESVKLDIQFGGGFDEKTMFELLAQIVHDQDDKAAGDDIRAAVDVLFAHRHSLPGDVLRSLQSVYVCASAAKYGRPYEEGWLDPEEFASHDVSECESGDGEDE